MSGPNSTPAEQPIAPVLTKEQLEDIWRLEEMRHRIQFRQLFKHLEQRQDRVPKCRGGNKKADKKHIEWLKRRCRIMNKNPDNVSQAEHNM